MTLYKKKPLPKRKVKKGQAGVIAIPAAGAVAGEAVSGAGSLPSAIVVGSIADYNRRKNDDWFLDLVYTSPTGVAWQRPIPSKPVVEVVEETPAEPVREEVHRPFGIDPVINIGVQVPDIDWGYDRSGIERILDYGRAKVKSFFAEDEPKTGGGSEIRGGSGTKDKPKTGGGSETEDKPKRYQKLWSWTKKQYNKGKDLWDKGKRLNHGPLYRIPLILNLGYDFRNWDENTPWYKKTWDVAFDSTPVATLLYFIKNLATSKLFNKMSNMYDLVFDDNTKTDNKSEEQKQKNDEMQVLMSDSIKMKLNRVNLSAQNTDTIE